MKSIVALCFGGRSSEYEISLRSAYTVYQGLSQLEQYEVRLLAISREGKFFEYTGEPQNIPTGDWVTDETHLRPVYFSPGHQTGYWRTSTEGKLEFQEVQVFFPVLHGKNGEDGTIQGLFDLMGAPTVGCGVLGSAAMMDKATARHLFETAHIPQPRWFSLCLYEWEKDPICLQERMAEQQLSLPVFVKPANAGSSVGISKVHTEEEWALALQKAFHEDEKILVEEAIEGRELECAVLQLPKAGEFVVSVPGEIIPGREFYDYEDKYDANSQSQVKVPAELPAAIVKQIQTLAQQAFQIGCCRGLARVDFFLRQEDERCLINEINTMPGFTSISMYPMLMEQSGYPLPKLVDTLIATALATS